MIARAIAAVTVAAAFAAPASATVRERFSFTDQWSYAQDCGFPVEVTGARTDVVIVREAKGSNVGAFPVLNRFSWREVWTHADTGDWFVIRGRGTFNEVRTTRVDGDIFSFTGIEAGQPFVVEDSDGTIVARNRGSVRLTYLFDTLGDGEPGGTWVSDVDFQVAGPHPSLFLHPCEYAAALLD